MLPAFCMPENLLSFLCFLPLLLLVVAEMEQGRDALVEEHGEEGDHHALEQVEGDHGEEDQGGYALDGAVHLGAHAHDHVQGHPEQGRELGQQVDGVEGAAEDGHDQGAHHQAQDGPLAAGLAVVDDAGREHEGAAHGEVGEVAHEGGGGALQDQLQGHLEELRDHPGHRAQIEGADQHWELA